MASTNRTSVSWTRQLILAAVLFVLGMGAYWHEFKQKPKSEAAEEESRKLFVISTTPVESVRIENAGQGLELGCLDLSQKLCKPGDNSKWQLTAPLRTRADDGNVSALLSSLNNLQVNESVDLSQDAPEKRARLLGDYGLNPAALRSAETRKVLVRTPSGGTMVYFGGVHPVGDRIFAAVEKLAPGQGPTGRIDDTKIYLVPGYFKSHFEHPLSYWRDKKLFTLTPGQVKSFSLQVSGQGPIRGEKNGSAWTLKSGSEETAGDLENVDSLVSGAAYLSAKDFASDSRTDAKAKAALAGHPSILSLALTQPDSTVTLTVYGKLAKGKPEGRLFASVSSMDPLFELEPTAWDRLNKTLKDLRLTKLITSMDRFTAKRVVFEGAPIGAKPLVLAQKDTQWLIEGTSSPIDNAKLQNLLDKLSGNRIQDFQKPGASNKETGALKLTLGDEKIPAKRELLFWRSGGKLFARDAQSKRNEIYVIDAQLQDALPWSAGFFTPEKKS